LRDRIVVPTALAAAITPLLVALGNSTTPPRITMAIPGDSFFIPDKDGNKLPFFPGRARTTSGDFIPLDNLSGSAACASCHKDVYDQWRSSIHSFAASNDHYVGQVKLRIHDVPKKPHLGARFCANCHEPIAMFAGEIDPGGRGIEIPQNREEGLSCLACHRMQKLHGGIVGNANYEITAHRSYLFQTDADPLRRKLGELLVRSKPSIHKKELRGHGSRLRSGRIPGSLSDLLRRLQGPGFRREAAVAEHLQLR